ncbi:hypothetical protein DM01DRAFT_301560 [Hesseltinella vesiculosa]|uniref:Uncharacterized protein n=1 Tax=Hesseltinella vesiculosa TaxID=101127 RepID=A0A1X2GG04_9FUNG|nr:hypothetical protein DM01DRAFT_301560 [Hesseltinella vesiculosa]
MVQQCVQFVLGILLIPWIFAYPSTPGTCHFDRMPVIGHGPSKSDCPGCYRFHIEPTSDNAQVVIQVMGSKPFQGLMLMVKDHTQKPVGAFIDYDQNLMGPVACDDDDDDHQGEETMAVLGHVHPHWKSWPVRTGWRADVTATGRYSVSGMVVIDYDNYHLIPEATFRIEYPVNSPSTNSTTTSVVGVFTSTSHRSLVSSPTLIVDPANELEWPVESPNPFFLTVLFATFCLYFGMVLLLRYWRHQQARDRARPGSFSPCP